MAVPLQAMKQNLDNLHTEQTLQVFRFGSLSLLEAINTSAKSPLCVIYGPDYTTPTSVEERWEYHHYYFDVNKPYHHFLQVLEA